MKDIKTKDFLTTKEVLVCYIYAVSKNEDGTLSLVYYYRKNKNNSVITKDWYCGVSEFAKYLIDGERIAYAGKIAEKDGEKTMINPSLVTVKTIDGKLVLTTASDDTESNNLLNLPLVKQNSK